MDSGFIRFLVVMLAFWAAVHGYVFARLASLPWLTRVVPPIALASVMVVLWLSYVGVRLMDSRGWHDLSRHLEPFAAAWIGLVFLLASLLLIADVLTLGGLLFSGQVLALRSIAVGLAAIFGFFGLWQGSRPPLVQQAEVVLPELPREHDGLRLLLLSDLHLGSLLGEAWLRQVTASVDALKPDVVAIAGDLADHDIARVEALVPVLSELRAPLGVWAVTGNHDGYAGLDRVHALMREAGFRVLADEAAEVLPGLIFAGVDDFSVPRRSSPSPEQVVKNVLPADAPGAVVLLSHTPLAIAAAARSGADLMLCGHTHGGQVWPFGLLVRTRFEHLGGRYEIGGMSLVVCRGTGTWGPRMRLWRRSEMWELTLRASAD